MRNIYATINALESTFSRKVRTFGKMALIGLAMGALQNTATAAGFYNIETASLTSFGLEPSKEFQKKAFKPITGLVTDQSGNPLPGATIVAKGSSLKAVTDSEGKFTLNVPDNVTILVVSYIGMESQEINISNLNKVSVMLKLSGTANLSEVVVTALGVKREKKALTFAAQQINGSELTKVGAPNFMEALSGKAAGIDISISNSGVGGSTKTVLRGSKSIIGNSEALFVIDGVPVVNNKGGQPGSYGGNDGGDGLSALNQDDFESVTVLRGANGSILYGSQGANGVILINTKKGQAGKIAISLSSTINLSTVSTLPEFQYDYGTASGGDRSWSKTKGNYQNNYINDFFQTGVNTINSLSVSGGNERTTTYFSYGNNNASGIVPTSAYNKHNVTLSQETKLFGDKLTLGGNVRFSYEKSKNRPGAGYYNNPLTGLYLFARERNFEDYKANYQIFDVSRNLYKQNWYSTYEAENNPYWEIYQDTKLNTSSRVIATAKASYTFLPHFKFDVRGNIDYNDRLIDKRYAAGGNSVSVSPNGTWDYSKTNDKALYGDAILSYDNTFGKFNLNSVFGASIQDNTFNDGMSFNNGSQQPLQYPNFFSFSNLPYTTIINQSYSRVQKQGAFANASLGFKDMIYLDLAGRNDWASTLATTGNDSYFYYSGGISAIISQMLSMPSEISFLKLRASTSKVGNEVPYNIVNPGNSIGGAGGPSGIGGINRNTQTPFATLVPEKIVSNEFGLESRFFNNRINFDFTYYKNTSTNQFLSLAAPSGSGYTSYYVNAGKVTNQGIELTLGGDPVKNDDFTWNSTLNLSRNKNKIVELITSNPDYIVGGNDEGFNSQLKAGGSFNDLYIYKYARNDAGQIILDAGGKPTRTTNQLYVGNLNPNLIAGWNNSFTYGNFSLSALVSAKFGGVAFSKTEAFLDSYGVSKRTGDARDAGGLPINAIQGTNIISTIDPAIYYEVTGDRNGIMEPYVFSRTNVRLAQLSLAYNLPLKSSVIKSASLSLVGRNLFFLYKKAPFDPEQAMSTSNSMQANDVFAVPGTRTYGLNLKLNF